MEPLGGKELGRGVEEVFHSQGNKVSYSGGRPRANGEAGRFLLLSRGATQAANRGSTELTHGPVSLDPALLRRE